MIAELGLFLLVVALLVALLQSTAPLIAAHHGNARWMNIASPLAILQLALVAASFACLISVFAVSDFSVEVVAANSHTLKPLFYKISAAWGHHEGSMLLWTLVLAAFGAAVALFGQNLPMTLKARVITIQGLIGAAFLAFIIFTSNPFARLPFAPSEGMGFNPLLQDPGLAMHPPTLYIGYVGLSIAYSFSIAALIEGKVDAAWARWVRPWVLAAWCFLTIGITMGSLWAYYELGWGGWWFWDPVENASFMPWLVATALLHSALVVERRHTLVNWTLLLSIVGFTFSLIGTFLVRSGVLTSVHAFAVDPARGVFILAMILAASGGALTLFALRAGQIAKGPAFAMVSRESSLLYNNMLLMCAAATVFLGTFYPLIIDIVSDDKISVGPPYFNLTFLPIMAVLIAIMAVGPMLRWRSDSLKTAIHPLAVALGGALVLGLLTLIIGKSALGAAGLALAAWLGFSLLVWLARKADVYLGDWDRSIRRLRALPLGSWGFLIGHLGLAVAAAGITGMSVWQSETTAQMRPGGTAVLGRYEFTLKTVEPVRGPNYEAEKLVFDVRQNGKPAGQISSEQRYYPERDMVTTEAGIRPGLFQNLFIAGRRAEGQPGYSVRINHHPLVLWIWGGGFLVALGGFVSLADRRLRVGAPHRAGRTPDKELAPAE